MSDNEEKNENAAPAESSAGSSRPNANYRLSKQDSNGEELVFYYNRERRLEKAPQAVRDLYKEEKPRRFGLFRSLINTKPRAMMFGSILLVCAAILVLSILGYTSGGQEFDGNRLSVQARRYGDSVVITVKKKTGSSGLAFQSAPYTGAVNIAVLPAGSGQADTYPPAVFPHRVFFTLEAAEDFQFTVPFDAEILILVFQTEKKTLSLSIKPE